MRTGIRTRGPQRILKFPLPPKRCTALFSVPHEDGVVECAANQGNEAKRLRELFHTSTLRWAAPRA